ncbi:MAG: LuxR C-terminal-related transcriptional regulator [Planctomycetota bacterium]
MTTEPEPTVDDIRGVFRLLNECLELWADPEAWQQHLLAGASSIVGDSPASQLQLFQPTDQPDRPQLIPLASVWPSEEARELYLESCDPASGVELPNFASAIGPAMQGGAIGITRPMVVPDEAWYPSPFFQRYVKPTGSDEFVIGITPAPQLRGLLNISTMRAIDAEPADHRFAAVLAILAQELVPLIGTRLALADQKSMAGLTPRQRQALELLLEGFSEKQVAAEMGVKLSTAHTYIVQLHKHFDVQSRGELMSYFVKRTPQPSD